MEGMQMPENRFLRGIYLMTRRYLAHNVGIQSAALAFYLLFMLFPFLIFISALLGLLKYLTFLFESLFYQCFFPCLNLLSLSAHQIHLRSIFMLQPAARSMLFSKLIAFWQIFMAYIHGILTPGRKRTARWGSKQIRRSTFNGCQLRIFIDIQAGNGIHQAILRNGGVITVYYTMDLELARKPFR